jgi:alkylation response protein AidB-like acyl-CoA dehydrogenase
MRTPDPLIRSGVRAALANLATPDDVRRQMTDARGWDPTVWRRLCGELGLAGMGIPERYGGAGFGWTDVAVAAEEAGRALLCAPFFSTVAMAVPTLLSSGDDDVCGKYLPEICAGTLTATLALADEEGRWNQPQSARARTTADGWRVDGSFNYVVDGSTADVIVVPALTEDGLGLFVVEAGAPGLQVQPLVTLDLTRRQAIVRLDHVPATRVGTADATIALAGALHIARTLLAAECVGGTQRCLDMTVEHVKTRIQFGRPIGSFQAVKQKAADMLIQVESARSAATQAASAADEAADDGPLTSAVAKLYCADAFMSVAADTIQLHGGIGFTWEHDAQLYFKRARTSQELLGGPELYVDLIAGCLEGGSLSEVSLYSKSPQRP